MRKFLTRWWYCADWQQIRAEQAITEWNRPLGISRELSDEIAADNIADALRLAGQ